MLHITLPTLRQCVKPIVEAVLDANSSLDKDYDGVVIAIVQELIDHGVTDAAGVVFALQQIFPDMLKTKIEAALKNSDQIWWFTNEEGELETLPI